MGLTLWLFQVIPGRSPYGSWDPGRCLRCAVVGNSGNLRGAGYGATIDGHDYIMRYEVGPEPGPQNSLSPLVFRPEGGSQSHPSPLNGTRERTSRRFKLEQNLLGG